MPTFLPAGAFVERLRGLALARRGVAELLERVGQPPAAGDHEATSFWTACLVCSVLDDSGLKQQFLSSTSTLARLQSQRQLLQQLSSAQQAQGCTIS